MEVRIWDVMVVMGGSVDVMGGSVDMGCDGGDGWRATDNCKSSLSYKGVSLPDCMVLHSIS